MLRHGFLWLTHLSTLYSFHNPLNWFIDIYIVFYGHLKIFHNIFSSLVGFGRVHFSIRSVHFVSNEYGGNPAIANSLYIIAPPIHILVADA